MVWETEDKKNICRALLSFHMLYFFVPL